MSALGQKLTLAATFIGQTMPASAARVIVIEVRGVAYSRAALNPR